MSIKSIVELGFIFLCGGGEVGKIMHLGTFHLLSEVGDGLKSSKLDFFPRPLPFC